MSIASRCNVVVFNSLIDACVRACDLQGAGEVPEGTAEGWEVTWISDVMWYTLEETLKIDQKRIKMALRYANFDQFWWFQIKDLRINPRSSRVSRSNSPFFFPPQVLQEMTATNVRPDLITSVSPAGCEGPTDKAAAMSVYRDFIQVKSIMKKVGRCTAVNWADKTAVKPVNPNTSTMAHNSEKIGAFYGGFTCHASKKRGKTWGGDHSTCRVGPLDSGDVSYAYGSTGETQICKKNGCEYITPRIW